MLVFGMMYGGMMMADYLALKHLAGNVARIVSNASDPTNATALEPKITAAIAKTTLIYCKTDDINTNVPSTSNTVQASANNEASGKEMKIVVGYNYSKDAEGISTVEVEVVSCPKDLPLIINALQPDRYLAKSSAVF